MRRMNVRGEYRANVNVCGGRLGGTNTPSEPDEKLQLRDLYMVSFDHLSDEHTFVA